MTTPEQPVTPVQSDDMVLTPEVIASMNLSKADTPAAAPAPKPLAPGEPAADPTLDERLIYPRGQTASYGQVDESAYQQAAEAAKAFSDEKVLSEESTQQEEAPRYFLVKKQKVTLGPIQHTKPSNLKDEEVTLVKTLQLPSTTGEGIEECVSNGNPRSIDENWFEVLDRSQKVLHSSTEHQDALSRENSSWHNRLLSANNSPLSLHRLRSSTDGEAELRAERASLAIRSQIGLGTMVNVPLWNSGMWLTIRDPGDKAIQEAVRQQVSERMRVGRSTHSLGFSNFMVYTIETMVSLILKNITSKTVHPDVNLIKNISILDFGTLVWGLASAVYPNGFEYARACTSGPEKCTHVVHEVLNLNTCLFVDESLLTTEQKVHMSNMKPGWAKEEDLQRYRDQFTANLGYQKAIKAGNGFELQLTMQVPTIGDCIDAGYDWINMVSNFVTEALGLDADNTDRQRYQTDIALTTAAGQFTQWIKELKLGNQVIKDRRTLMDTFYEDISPDGVLLDNLQTAIKDFSTKSMMAVVGILNYTCPSCKKPQMVAEGDDPADPKEKLPLVVAIDPTSTFLELMFRKFLEIRQRG